MLFSSTAYLLMMLVAVTNSLKSPHVTIILSRVENKGFFSDQDTWSFSEVTSSSSVNISFYSLGEIRYLKGKKRTYKYRAELPSLRRSTTKVNPVVRGCKTYSYFWSPFFSANSLLRALVLAEGENKKHHFLLLCM